MTPTDDAMDAVLCSHWPAFSMQATLVRMWVRDAVRESITKWSTPTPAGEPVYQACFQNGFWQDCSKERYEYLKNPKLTSVEDWEIRILFTAPPVREPWQPIETAPKDEKYRDGSNAYSAHILVWYPGAMAPMRARWWQADSGINNFLADGGFALFPTHWMPLPPPPIGITKGATC